ncbi:MAG: hypothetical protein EHM61_03330 [Acidobacteria bacterium]|nr:MAG: hypothetical protein EHM61_03330 [Acidobacteriota bacterium]
MLVINLLAALGILTLIYFLVLLVGHSGLTVLSSVLVGFGSQALVRLLREQSGPLSGALLSLSATLVAVFLMWSLNLGGRGPWDWFAVLVAPASAIISSFIASRKSLGHCFVCRSPLRAGQSVICPRCGQETCLLPDCWDHRHLRCRPCFDRGVVVLPIQPGWWTRQLGKRATQGQCVSCYKDAGEADLRECGRCRWPMCCRCWDHHNAQCPRCRWIIPEVPAPLRGFLGDGAAEEYRPQGSRRVSAAGGG